MDNIAMFTDIHFGRKGNSKEHNDDCLVYIRWFCEEVKGKYDKIIFLGDWFENRSSINVETLNYSYISLTRLNDLGIPVYFCVGNHDLYKRHNREVYSTKIFDGFSNIQVIDKITVIDDYVLSPYLFEYEYKDLLAFTDKKAFFGHFEFRNFLITEYNTSSEKGVSHQMFKDVEFIFSGHFHKRQIKDNTIYIGNTFPMDYGDILDNERGYCSFDGSSYSFVNWEECPKYMRLNLSSINDTIDILVKNDNIEKSYIECVIDTDISYTDAQALRKQMIEEHNVREFVLKENKIATQLQLEGDGIDLEDGCSLDTVNEMVISQLEKMEQINLKTKMDNKLLSEIYRSLPTDENSSQLHLIPSKMQVFNQSHA